MAEGAREQDNSSAPRAAGARTQPDTGKLRVFISYSRDDLDFADQLFDALELTGYDPTMDRHGISGGEEWRERLGNLIRDADTIVFVLSPHSAKSEMCAWEVAEATRLKKRILPVLCRPLEGAEPPERLASLDYIFFYFEPRSPGTGFGSGLKRLVQALNSDLDWLREHTRLLQRATEWEEANRVANRMLSGADIAEAKAWAARRPKSAPEPTALHLDFIRASEAAEDANLSAERHRLAEMAAAQEARTKALTEREQAVREAAEAQKARARAQRIIAWGSATAALVLAVVAALAGVQWRAAEHRKEQATNILSSAARLIFNLLDAKKIDAENFDHVAGVFQRGAEFGDTRAMVGLGFLYDEGHGVTRDHAKAREWYEKAAARGDALAMSNLGVHARESQGEPQDYAKAREWFEKAAAKDNVDAAEAMNNLGGFYHNGQGVTHDYGKAREWYEKAVAKDHVLAMNNLGVLYREGQGVPQDYGKAREWYEKAAAKEHADAMTNLGALYYSGHGVTQDYGKAREWFEKAAAKDHALAMNNLGALYQSGQGVPQDYAKAREWFEKAAALGDEPAKASLERMTIEQAEAEGRYADALRLHEALAAKIEAVETKRDGKPGKETAGALSFLSWQAVVAREHAKALAVAERALALDPEVALVAATNRAHALLFVDRADEARAHYLALRGKKFQDDTSLEQIIADDFAKLRKAGLDHPLMAEIEAAYKAPAPGP